MFGSLRFVSKYLCFEIGFSVWEEKLKNKIDLWLKLGGRTIIEH